MIGGTVHLSNSSLFHETLIIGQLNVPAATAENEEQYNFSNIIYIGFQNSYRCKGFQNTVFSTINRHR